MQQWSQVNVLIWDLDGTLYKPKSNISRAIRECEYQVITSHTRWSKKKVIEEFYKVYKVVTPSGTKTAAIVSGIPTVQAARECQNFLDRRKFLSRDDRLIEMFNKLSHYTHFMLINGTKRSTSQALEVLGIPPRMFVEIVSSETVGENKPSPKGFLYILKKTGIEPSKHLMIGDRVDVDLVPAKKLGFKTCLVWSTHQSPHADITLRSIYDLASVLV